MRELSFYDYIYNSILDGDWYRVLGSSFFIIIVFNWLCAFYRKVSRSVLGEKNLAAFTIILVYILYEVFIYMPFRAEKIMAFDYAVLITAIAKYWIGLNIYHLIKHRLLKFPQLKARKELTGFIILFLLGMISNHVFVFSIDGRNAIQILFNNIFFHGRGVNPIPDPVDTTMFRFYGHIVDSFIFAGVNSIINITLSKQAKKDYEKELELSSIKNQLLKTQIESLNSRINPHFLYNTLNSIAALTLSDTVKSRNMIIKLSKLFRYNVNREQEAFSEVDDEAEMISSYLDIEKIRFGDKLQFEIDITDGARKFKMPRFLLQPLIENSIKYGLQGDQKVLQIKIKVFQESNTLIMQVIDSGAAFAADFVPGYGLKSVYDKLSLLYPDNYEVSIINQPEKMVEIRINNANPS